MKLHYHKFEQFLPISLDEAWDFFSAPQNLNEITPPEMKFEILTKEIPRMYAGQIVQYNVTPFPFFTSGWVTEITQVEDRKMFIDEQRFGPRAPFTSVVGISSARPSSRCSSPPASRPARRPSPLLPARA